ncbi:universal stress protein [Mycobacterium sp.]|uniref:universal stress protein n=1 Tax=Mycobacterium sp. TaxID=1785 RepID=UPI003BB12029
MIADRGARPVVVGIDGSKAAVRAAVWGAAEALQRDIALKLLYVIDSHRSVTPGVVKAQHLVAGAALRDANAAVEAMQRPIKIELDTICGDPGTVLIEESRSAALLCVGAPKANPNGPFDSLATDMAAHARCTVAVVPAIDASAEGTGWVATLLEPSTIDYDVLQQAMEEAELRRLPLHAVMATPATAAVDELLISWTQKYPHMDLSVVHTDQLLRYVAEHEVSIRSMVLGASRRGEIAKLIELIRSRAAAYNDFSVIAVRGQHL